MEFRLRPNEYFRGVVVEPDGERREIVVQDKGARASVIRLTTREASKRNWDWVITLMRSEDDGDGSVTVVARWSELAGDDLPPLTRDEVQELQGEGCAPARQHNC